MNSSLLLNAFDVIPVSLIIIDENALIGYINKTALSLIGKEFHEVVGKNLNDSFRCLESLSNENGCGNGTKCNDCEIKKALTRAFDGHATEQEEVNITLYINGLEKSFWFYISAAPFMSEGKINAILTIEDITEKKNNEIMRLKSELNNVRDKLGRYYKLAEITENIILFIDMDGNIIDANNAAVKTYGYTYEELCSSNIHYIDADKEAAKERIEAAAREGIFFETIHHCKDGSCINVEVSSRLISSNGRSILGCIIRNITERKIIEEKLHESEMLKDVILSNLPGMVYRCKYDREWTMQYVSDGCYTLTGYSPESLLHNKEVSFNDLINPEYREYLWDKWSQTLPKRGNIREEYSITTASGEVKWVLEEGHGVYDEGGEVIALEGLIIDITTRKKKEDEIQYLNYHDVLTGLYNRRFLEEKIRALEDANLLPVSIIIGDINGLKLINDTIGHKKGDALIIAISKILQDCVPEHGILARTGGDEFSIVLPRTSNDEADRLMKSLKSTCNEYISRSKNAIKNTSISFGCATKVCETDLLEEIVKKAEDSMHRKKLLQNGSMHSSVISSMKRTLFEKSQETEEHALRLIKLSKAIGNRMNLTDEQLNELELLSTLHDIGKIGISDIIINKPDRLSEEERILMNKHPEIGYRIAVASYELQPIAECILSHHERYDGKGYPYGLQGDEIPLLSRIIAVVDAYDAMTEDRVYRKAMSKDEAVDEIRRNAGTQFDPLIVDIFLDIISEY